MPKLNQIIAIEATAKKKSETLTESHQLLQKPGPISGIARSYQPRDEDGERLPPESTRVQVRVEDELERVATALTEWFDVTATKEFANCNARASVVVGAQMILTDVPVTYLLFLEKRLVDLHTYVGKLPTLDPAETWKYDPGQSCYATEPVETVRTKKVPRNHEASPATKEHPAQVQVYMEDVAQGNWRTIKFSGAVPMDRVRTLLERVEALQQAVKMAREEANNIEVSTAKAGKLVFDYLFAK